MLLETVEEWNKEIEARGLEKGRKEGLKQGRQRGRQEGRSETLLQLLQLKFGDIDAGTRARVAAASPRLLTTWTKRILTAERLADVFGH